jgi:hypothetical protein
LTNQPPKDNRAVLSVSGDEFSAPVLGRLISVMAARAQCPIDRLDDAVLIGEALAAHAPEFAQDGWTTIAVETNPTAMTLRVGPLVTGSAGSLIAAAAIPGVGNVIEQLAGEVTTGDDADGDTLDIVIDFFR